MAQDPTHFERDRRAMAIFAQTCGLAAADRTRLLAELCGNDAGVRTKVEAMLTADGSDAAPLGSDAEVDRFVERQIGGITPGSDPGPDFPAASHAVDGEYTILRVIGEGGMGTVYEAEQHHPRRRVAIKAIRPGRITPEMGKRFEYEAQVLARLEHPGIARLYESNAQSEGGRVRAYLAMELVDGVAIDAYCEANSLSTVERLRLFMKVCNAVSYAHRMGVIHRDLKPANILVNGDGDPKVLDFGVARTVGRQNPGVTLLTHHGQIIGTLAYMSPEQIEGRADVDTRADVYSLGVILYRLLTGLLPIDVSRDGLVDASRRILSEAPVRVGRHDRRLKGDLEIVVGRALEKDPARRYPSVDQLRDELDRYLGGRPIEARADSTFYVFRKAVWRQRGPVSIGLLLLAMLTTFGIVSSIQAGRRLRLAVAADVARAAAVGSEKRVTERAEALRRLLYFSNIGFAQSALENNDMERAYRLLDGCDPSLREWEWSYLQRQRDVSTATTDLRVDRPRYASFTRDRSRLALATLDRTVVLLDAVTHEELLRVQLPDGTARAALSPDGRWLAYGARADSVVVMELATGALRHLPMGKSAASDARSRGLRVVRFTEDSASLVTGGGDQRLRVWDVASATARLTIPFGKPLPVCVLLSPGNDWAAVGDTEGGLRVFDLRTGALLRTLEGHDAPVWSLALSHDGKRLASGDNDARTIVWDPASGSRITHVDTDDGWITALCFSPDDSRLALGRSDSTTRLLDLRDASTTGVLRGHRHSIVHIEWPADDVLHTLSLDGTSKSWSADPARQVPTIVTTQPESIALAFDPSGENVLVGGSDGTVRRWSVSAGPGGASAEGRRLQDHSGAVLEIAVHAPSGRICTAGRDGVIRITRADGAAPPLVISPGSGGVSAVDFSPDGRWLLLGTDREVGLWDSATGQKLRDFSAPGVVANELTFDGRAAFFYGACADGRVRRWDVNSKNPVADTMVDSHGLYDVQLNPDGMTLAVAGDTQSVTLLDVKSLAPIRQYAGHRGGVLGVAFHPGGRRVASAGTDGSVRVWDLDTATELICLRGHRRRIQHIAFSPDGQTLASSSDDGTVKFWRTIPSDVPAPN